MKARQQKREARKKERAKERKDRRKKERAKGGKKDRRIEGFVCKPQCPNTTEARRCTAAITPHYGSYGCAACVALNL